MGEVELINPTYITIWDVVFKVLIAIIGILLTILGTATVMLLRGLMMSNKKLDEDYNEKFTAQEEKTKKELKERDEKIEGLKGSMIDTFKKLPLDFIMKEDCILKTSALWGKIERMDKRTDSRLRGIDGKIDRQNSEMHAKIDSVQRFLCGKMDKITSLVKGINNES